jgi:hypothetical protein
LTVLKLDSIFCLDASSLAKCQIDCLTASENLGFTCKSAMFYPTDVESGQVCYC